MPVNQPLVITFAAWEDSAAVFMARIKGLNGAAITIATVSTITFKVGTIAKVEGVDTYTAVVEQTSLTVADVISDTLLTTAPWTKDGEGRNFTHEMEATAFPSAHARYRIQYEFTPAVGGAAKKWQVVFEGKINEIFGQ